MSTPFNAPAICENYSPFIPYKLLNPQHPIGNLYFRIDFEMKFITVAYFQTKIWLEEWKIETTVKDIDNLASLIFKIEKNTPLDTCDLNMGRDMQTVILSWADTNGTDTTLTETARGGR